jgi:hypothetical protein
MSGSTNIPDYIMTSNINLRIQKQAWFHCDVKLSQTCPIRSNKRAQLYKETILSFQRKVIIFLVKQNIQWWNEWLVISQMFLSAITSILVNRITKAHKHVRIRKHARLYYSVKYQLENPKTSLIPLWCQTLPNMSDSVPQTCPILQKKKRHYPWDFRY